MEGTTGRQRLPKNVLSNLLMPFPKEKQQINMLNYMYFIENKINNEISKKQALDSLFKSMLEQLMTGALRVNDLEVDQCSTQA
jgi:type I restriction enzyme S subunit